MAEQVVGPTFPVYVDEREHAEDLSYASEAGRAAIKPLIERLKLNGVPVPWLRRCDSEARDGTRLPGCVKIYIPQPAGQWGAVFLGGTLSDTPTLFLRSAIGIRVALGSPASTRPRIVDCIGRTEGLQREWHRFDAYHLRWPLSPDSSAG